MCLSTGCTTPSLSQSMYFTGTNSTMFPVSDAMAMGVSTRSTPTLWQYPSKSFFFVIFFFRTKNASRKKRLPSGIVTLLCRVHKSAHTGCHFSYRRHTKTSRYCAINALFVYMWELRDHAQLDPRWCVSQCTVKRTK